MESSILTSTKKILGIGADYTDFDLDIITHINSVFADLYQIGIGPENGFMIEDETTKWVDFLDNDKTLNSVQTYVYTRVRLLFDPPTTQYAVEALQKQIEKMEWRLNVQHEHKVLNPVEPMTAP